MASDVARLSPTDLDLQVDAAESYLQKLGTNLQDWLNSKDFDPVDHTIIERRIKERLARRGCSADVCGESSPAGPRPIRDVLAELQPEIRR